MCLCSRRLKVSIQEIIRAPLYPRPEQMISVEAYLTFIIDQYEQLRNELGEVTWNDLGLCNGIFLLETVSLLNVQTKPRPLWREEMYDNKGLIW